MGVFERNGRLTRLGAYLFLGFVFVVAIPFGLPETTLGLVNRMLIWGLFAMGYDFMFGYSGVVSFGHAALFGLGAYAFAVPINLLGVEAIPSLWLLLVLSVLVSTVYALIVGTIAIRTREVYFAILTLAFAQVMFILVFNATELTGGADGIVYNLPDFAVVPGLLSLSMYEEVNFYFLVLPLVTLTYLFLRRLTKSPMGAVLRGVRENVDRLEYIGIDERRYRIGAFTVSGAVSGLAGGLYAIDLSFAGPESLNFVLSGEVIVWTILGGQGTLLGPLFGGAVVFFIADTVSSIITWWLIPVGLLFILVVIFTPEGVAGLVLDFLDDVGDADAENDS